MAATSSIEWTDATWNVITGCTWKSRGCDNCYAAQLAATRLRQHPSRSGLVDGKGNWTGEVRFNGQWLDQPLRWRRPRRIFTVAHGDLFHEAVPDKWLDLVFAVIAQATQHTFQILTKRPGRARHYLSSLQRRDSYPWPHVWLGTSAEDQAAADARISMLALTPAVVRWVSLEPLLGPIDLSRISIGYPYAIDARYRSEGYGGLHWVVAGGESGPGARPMHPDWVRSLRDQCIESGTPFFFKQWGGRRPGSNGRILDARTWDEMPGVASL